MVTVAGCLLFLAFQFHQVRLPVLSPLFALLFRIDFQFHQVRLPGTTSVRSPPWKRKLSIPSGTITGRELPTRYTFSGTTFNSIRYDYRLMSSARASKGATLSIPSGTITGLGDGYKYEGFLHFQFHQVRLPDPHSNFTFYCRLYFQFHQVRLPATFSSSSPSPTPLSIPSGTITGLLSKGVKHAGIIFQFHQVRLPASWPLPSAASPRLSIPSGTITGRRA